MTYTQKLDAILDEVFTRAAVLGISHNQLAAETGMRVRTVQRLSTYETRLPRLKTILAMCWAVGMDLVLGERKPARRGKKRRAA